jgi:hypothetical protein
MRACPSCGAPDVDGLEGCRAVFNSLAEREFSDPAFFASHRLCVDAYSLQHPDEFMKSTKSAAAHLAGMCWSLEVGRSEHLPEPLKRWVDGPRQFTRVEPPPQEERGVLTVLSATGAQDAADYERRVLAWGRSAWDAWARHHEQARAWVAEAKNAAR